ncbi:fas-associated death domain protein isoform X1 [Anopheles funestus]|uniref:fas-associated death domain protein isoform X1 n=1 Tax=Anopheles funestus TaxID=62324 RepID=UPI0020C6924F|nr:fas-associated death domain protein isoform X1 [Anopheles funestus]
MERISVQDHRTVYEQMCKDYLNLKLLAQNACPDREHLERCKNSVREEVHSCRKLCRVTEFDHLVLLLEQRNLLSLLKPDLIERFELALDAKDVSCALKSYRSMLSSHYAAIRRFHLEDLRHRDRRTLLEKEVEKIKLHETNDTLMPSAVNTKRDKYLQQRDKVYSLLQLEIGKSWKPFGRFLNVPPAVLEEIEDRNRQDLKTRIYEVLHWAEKQFADDTLDQFFVVLLKALENTRRKDLKRKIESMLQE